MFSITSKLKNVVILAICFSLLIPNVSIYAEESVNLIDEKNSSCESLDDFNTNTLQTVTREIDSEIYRSGSGSVKITIPGNFQTFLGIKPTESLVEGERYRFSIWYYTDDIASSKMYLRFATTDNSIGNWITGTKFDSAGNMTSGEWTKYEYIFTATDTLANNLKYFYMTAEATSGTIYFDDITLEKMPSSGATLYRNLIEGDNSSCESIADFDSNTYQSVTRQVDSSVSHSGEGSIKVTIPGSYQTLIGVKPSETLIEGEEYTFSVWYYNPENLSGKIILRFATITGHSISNWITGVAHDTPVTMESGAWTKYEWTFTATNKLATDLKYFYITTTAESGSLYFDDFSVRRIPDAETALTTTDLDEFESVDKLTLEFDNEIDIYTLPESVLIDGGSVSVASVLSDNNKIMTLSFNDSIASGSHTLTFDCGDVWNRTVNVSASFKVAGGAEEDVPVSYDNLFDETNATCETIADFETNNYPEPDKADVIRAIDNEIYHSGEGSLKITIPGSYRTFAGIVPTENLIEGEKYNFSVWYYKPDTSAQSIYLRFASITGHSISNWITGVAHDTKTTMKNQTWTRFDYTFTATNKLAADLRYFYITSTAANGEIYLDDFSLRRIPAAETTLLKNDFGKFDTIEELTLTFDKEIDKYSLPESILIDGNPMNVEPTLLEDGKSIVVKFKDVINPGSHTLTLDCKDVWNRTINASAAFEVENVSGGTVNIYGNLINNATAACEDIREFNENAFPEEIERIIDKEIYHSGTGSLKTTFPGSYKPLASFKPNASLIAGEKYYFSVWYYTEGVTGTKRIFLRYASDNNTTISNWITGEKYDSGKAMVNGAWTKYVFEFTATEALAASTFTNFYLTTEINEGTVYFDDINLRLVSPETITLVDYSPKENEKNVKLGSGLRIEFTGEADSSDVNAALYVNGELDESGFACETDENVLIIKPKSGLLPDTEYKIVINSINDAYGRPILTNKEISFKTANRLGFDISFFDGNNSEITKLKTGSITANIDIKNNNGVKTECIAVIMVCEGQRVKKVYATPEITLKPDETISDIELAIDNVPNGNCYLKAFLWTEATESLRTLSECIEFR